VHLVGFTVEMYYDAQSYKRQIKLLELSVYRMQASVFLGVTYSNTLMKE
jgi:hypothetical protein